MKFIIKIAILITFLCFSKAYAQELNCTVEVNSSQISGSDKSVYIAMQKAIFEFMNNRKWTGHVYQNTERIQCNILINITEVVSNNNFKATLQLQSTRPVFNTSYNSTALNHLDKEIEFKFNEFDPLDYSETTHMSNLTSILAFYSYIVIALDYDSFSLKGGTKYFEKAVTIVNNAQSAPESGWKAFESTKNRYWMVQNYLHPNYEGLRLCWYGYHRRGFDVMAKDATKGRSVVLKNIKLLEGVHKQNPGSFQMQLFFNAKDNEIVNLFKDKKVPTSEKTEVYNILNKINPMNASKYNKIIKGK